MNLFKKNPPIKGSVLVFSLIVLSFMLISALSVATVSVTEKRASFSTERSNRSFQVADSGVEIILQKIYKGDSSGTPFPTLALLADDLSTTCSNAQGEIGGTLNAGAYNISFYDNSGAKFGGSICSDPLWRSNVVKIKSEGTSGNTTRAVEVGIEPFLPPPTLNFSASPTSVSSGGSSTLTWTTTNTTSCLASNGWSGAVSNTGDSSLQSNITSSKTFTLECWNSASVSTGQKSATVTVSGGGGGGGCISYTNVGTLPFEIPNPPSICCSGSICVGQGGVIFYSDCTSRTCGN